MADEKAPQSEPSNRDKGEELTLKIVTVILATPNKDDAWKAARLAAFALSLFDSGQTAGVKFGIDFVLNALRPRL